MKIHIIFTYSFLIIIQWRTTLNITLLLLWSIQFIITINTHIPFKLIFLTTLDLIQNIIIILISHNNRMSLYCIFCFIFSTKFLRDVFNISYYDNLNIWIKYCASWDYNGLLKCLLFPIPICVLLHGERILCPDN